MKLPSLVLSFTAALVIPDPLATNFFFDNRNKFARHEVPSGGDNDQDLSSLLVYTNPQKL